MKKTKIYLLIVLVSAIASVTVFSNLFASAGGDMVTLTGKFTDITRPNVLFKTSGGTEYRIHLGPAWYWEEKNYTIKTDAETELYGKLSGDSKEVFAYSIKQGDVTIKLTDDNGDPLWWKDGKGKNRNNDWGYGRNSGRGNCGNCPCQK